MLGTLDTTPSICVKPKPAAISVIVKMLMMMAPRTR